MVMVLTENCLRCLFFSALGCEDSALSPSVPTQLGFLPPPKEHSQTLLFTDPDTVNLAQGEVTHNPFNFIQIHKLEELNVATDLFEMAKT